MTKTPTSTRRRAPAAAKGTAAPRTEDLRATHIVLFRERLDENAAMMSQVMSLAQRNGGAGTTAGILELGASGANIPAARIYADLGCASITASEADVERLRNSADVEGVYVNETRSLPTPVGPFEARLPSVAGLDYLRGLRDGIDQALAALGHGGPPSPWRSPETTVAGLPYLDTNGSTWGLKAIGVDRDGRPTGRGVIVAVLDTGLDLRHPDFRARIAADHQKSFIAGEDVQDEHGHGTHCCGTVNGPLRPADGGRRYGIAPDATLLVGKVLSNAGHGQDSGIVDAIQWAALQGARVISMSLGSPRGVGEPYSQLYERIADRLLRPRTGNGTLLVAAAGNDSRRPASVAAVINPAACPSILSVAAIDANLRIAYFSCKQLDGVGSVDLSAPGLDVYSSWTGGGSKIISGTSMATPHVAGLAALMFEADPTMSALEAWDRLKLNARNLGDPLDFGAGLIQMPS